MMNDTIDFTECMKRKKTYAGANGNKISIIYNEQQYMLKFPAIAKLNKSISYTNSCISEYIGCHIFQSIGIDVQDTVLGTYKVNGKEKIVVACKDFTQTNVVLQDFGSVKNQVVDSEHGGYGTELSDIEESIKKQDLIDSATVLDHFWNIFIVDALIGNWDRHNGNWGFLYNAETDDIKLAPVFDCGSSLYPQADEKIIKSVLSNSAELNFRIYEIPLSAIKMNDKKINYFEFISSLKNKNCNKALKRITPKIDMEEIQSIVQNTPFISDLQKEFYTTMIQERKKRILDYTYSKIMDKEKNNNNSSSR